MHVLKIGGNELDNPLFLAGLATAVASDPEPVAIVHGGGRAIAGLQARLGIKVVQVDGLRVTDAESLAVAQMVLSGETNKKIVAALLAAGVDALGLSGVDRGLFRCRKRKHPTADLGYVGDIVHVRSEVITQLVAQGVTPVISPISLGTGPDAGQIFNVNADEAAGALARAIEATLLDFVSNVPGVLAAGGVVAALTPSQAHVLISQGVIRDGMVPKVAAALAAVAQGIPQTRIVDLPGLAGGASRGTAFLAEEPT